MHKIFIAQKSYCPRHVQRLATIRSKYYFNFILIRTRSGQELFDRPLYVNQKKGQQALPWTGCQRAANWSSEGYQRCGEQYLKRTLKQWNLSGEEPSRVDSDHLRWRKFVPQGCYDMKEEFNVDLKAEWSA